MPRGDLPYLNDAGRSSLTEFGPVDDRPSFNRRRFTQELARVGRFRFWNGGDTIHGLGAHQRAAVSHAIAYLASDRRLRLENDVNEAALLKLPTGSGKSGIIAVLSRCLKHTKRILLLTPRDALTEQLREDVSWRFWNHMGYASDDGEQASAAAVPLDEATIKRLKPSRVPQILELCRTETPRIVLVSTLQALDEIRRDARKAAPAAIELEDKSARCAALLVLLKSFDLVVVDEGHYEPAPSWSRAIRAMDRPTILLSATPFRNDYKSFRVRGNFVYNFSFHAAAASRVIRDVIIRDVVPPARPLREESLPEPRSHDPDAEYDTTEERPLEPSQETGIREFVQVLHREWPLILHETRDYTPHPKCILRAASYEALVLLQTFVETELGERALLIHERVPRDDANTLRFHSVQGALAHGTRIRFWLHQSKLLEGIDDPSIVAVGVLDGFANTRHLVQQIGRAIRSTDPKRHAEQTAHVFALPLLTEDMRKRWALYLSYEQMSKENVRQLVQSEGALPDRLLKLMLDYQYIDGEFRKRYLIDGNVRASDLRVSLRTSIYLVKDGFDLEEAELELEEALLSEDRFLPRRIEDLPEGMIGRTYYGWGTSPYLGEHYLAEWSLGMCVASHIGPFLFVQDTGGICFEPEKLRIRKADRATLLKVFPQSAAGDTVMTRFSGNMLDLSDSAIRSQSYRTRDFETTFTDLSDPSFVPGAAYGYVKGVGRYLGIKRARLSDATGRWVDLRVYHRWLETLRQTLTAVTSTHNVFGRYAQITTCDDEEAKPISILLELTTESAQEFEITGDADPGTLGHDLGYNDLCSDIDPAGDFTITLRDGSRIPCRIAYVPKIKRYRLHSPRLDAKVTLPGQRSGSTRTITQLVNRDQNFCILATKPKTVYTLGNFFIARDLVSEEGTVFALESAQVIPALAGTVSEKGERFYPITRQWRRQSIFGLIHGLCNGRNPQDELGHSIATLDTLLLDDGPKEVGDFIGLDRVGKRVVLIHAKASEQAHRDGVAPLQTVGRQAMASLAFCSAQGRPESLTADRWSGPVVANTIRLDGLSRVFKQPRRESLQQTAGEVISALSNPTFTKEIWIVAGRLLDITHVRHIAVRDRENMSARCRQLLMYLMTLQTSCQRAHTVLRIFAHENAA